MKRAISLLALLLAGGITFAQAPKKILFDHTGYEDGGVSAYWIIDTHEPDPSPSNPSVETDWNGGISAWAFDLHQKGYTVQTLPATGSRITYNDATNPQDLKNYSAFIIPECYRMFTAAEKQAIVAYVQAGGGLYLMGNHDGATRVTNQHPGSTDAFHVFNDLLANEGSGFGFTFVLGHGPGDASANTTTTAITPGTGPIETALAQGTNGVVTAMDFHSFAYLNITGTNPSATWIVQTQVSGDPATDYFVVASTYGAGRVVAIGDSAPSDDGTTTTSGKSLHADYNLNSNRAFLLNAADWLAGGAAGGSNTVTATITTPSGNVTLASGASQAFAGSATDSSSSASLSYSWNFGDGSTATGASASHVFTNTGTSNVVRTVAFTATDNTGASSSATRAVTVTPASSGGGSKQLLQNPGFESGVNNWSQTSGVIGQNGPSEPANSGTWDAWLDGYGSSHTDTLAQTVTIPSTASSTILSFWLHVDSDETTTSTAYDKLTVQVLSSSGAVLRTLAVYSNLDAAAGYSQRSFDLSAYKGQTLKINLKGVEDSSLQTSFVVDDFALTVQ